MFYKKKKVNENLSQYLSEEKNNTSNTPSTNARITSQRFTIIEGYFIASLNEDVKATLITWKPSFVLNMKMQLQPKAFNEIKSLNTQPNLLLSRKRKKNK